MKLEILILSAATALASAYKITCVPSPAAIGWKYKVSGITILQTTASPAAYADDQINGKAPFSPGWDTNYGYGFYDISQLENKTVVRQDSNIGVSNGLEHVITPPAPSWYSWKKGWLKDGNLDEFREVGNKVIDQCIKNYVPGIGSAGDDKVLAITASEEDAKLLQTFSGLF